MPICQANDLSFQLENGVVLFDNISFSLQSRLTGLVGRNGVGKSVLASLIKGDRVATRGQLQVTYSIAAYDQQFGEILDNDMSIAQFLGVKPILDAIEKITNGECAQALFDQVGDDWLVEKRLYEQMQAMGLPADIHLPCSNLSGGQLARLQLWQLFYRHRGLLVLDEPSNHLDVAAKRWLINEIRQFQGVILLISHDRMMLREMDEIWELNQLGLTRYGGNYDLYHHEKTLMRDAVDNEIAQLKRQEKLASKQRQRQREKADQRAAQGNRVRKTGSQPKVLLDYQKNSAESAASARRKQDEAQVDSLALKMRRLREKQEVLQIQTLAIPERAPIKGLALTLSQLKLPFVSTDDINVQLDGKAKIRIKGNNGCGKSTLLKVIAGHIQPVRGEVRLRAKTSYLDQNFSFINDSMSVLDNFLQASGEPDETTARTYLAGAGLTADKVGRLSSRLSGGERMKLAILMINHQPGQNLLLLDEPDNHLDLDSKQVLADALRQYQGPIMIVSHDDDFIAACGITRHYALSENQMNRRDDIG